MKQQLIITKGLPASGKSTWAKEWALVDPIKRVIISRDGLRLMLGKYWVGEREKLVTSLEKRCIFEALTQGYDVVIDSTGFRWTNEDNSNYVRMFNVEVTIEDFTDVPLEVCIKRDSKREMKVGEEIITNFYNRYIKDELESRKA